MKKVRNSARPNITWLGGAEGVPRALRSRPRTMMMRVKLVIISSMAGKKLSEVSNTRVCTGSDQLWPPLANGWLIRPGSCAKAVGLSNSKAAANTRRSILPRPQKATH
ncbi:hypothetical protein D3C72_1717330 [compost metagenome]